MNEQEMKDRIAAQATQVAVLHNALKLAKDWIGAQVGDNAKEYDLAMAQIGAALKTGEADCAVLLRMARTAATGEDKAGVDRRALLLLLNRIEGRS